MTIPVPRSMLRLLKVEEFQRLAEIGILRKEDRVELIRGEMFEMNPVGNNHAITVMSVADRLAELKPMGIVNPQNPLRLPEQQSVLYPDVALLRRRPDFGSHPPHSGDVLFLVEVSDSSLAYDREIKIPLYTDSGIPEVWLVDLTTDSVFAYRRPSPRFYQEVRQYRRGDTISPEAFPDTSFAVEEILG